MMACSDAAAELVCFVGFGAVATALNTSVFALPGPASVSAGYAELLDIDPLADPPADPLAAPVVLFGIAGAA